MDSFVYGVVDRTPVVKAFSVTGDAVTMEWMAVDYAVAVEFTPTLMPADWQPVTDAQRLQTNYVELVSPTNSSQGFFRVIPSP
jgi:hypothetical protein